MLLVSPKTLSPTVIKSTCVLEDITCIFPEIYVPQSIPFIVGILYRSPDKIDIVNYIDQIFNQFNTLGTLNARVLPSQGRECKFTLKIEKTPYREMALPTKKIIRILLF